VLIRQKRGGIAHHCKSSDLWGAVEAAQPEVAADKTQMALLSTQQDARSIGESDCRVLLVTTRHPTPRAQEPIDT